MANFGNFEDDINESKRIMYKSAPILKQLFMQIPNLFNGNIMIYPVEDQPGKVCNHLDKSCGIDYLVVDGDRNRTVGLAWRTGRFWKSRHYGSIVYNAFSLRERRNNSFSKEDRCEISKRRISKEFDLLRPTYTAQMHYDPENDNELLSLAIAKTDDIIEAHDRGFYRLCDKHNTDKEVIMHDVQWEKMKQFGYEVYDWYAKNKYKGLYELCVCDQTKEAI